MRRNLLGSAASKAVEQINNSKTLFWIVVTNLVTASVIVHVLINPNKSIQPSFETKASTSPESSLAYKQSFGLFDDISDLMWQRMRHKVHTTSLYWNPENPLHKVEHPDFWIKHNIFPTFDCPHNVELGGKHGVDGTKFVCNPDRLIHETKPDCLVYSIGCAGMYQFEDALFERHQKKCEIHVFDPAPKFERKGDVENKNIHYHAWGFVSTYDAKSKSNVWPAGRGGGSRLSRKPCASSAMRTEQLTYSRSIARVA